LSRSHMALGSIHSALSGPLPPLHPRRPPKLSLLSLPDPPQGLTCAAPRAAGRRGRGGGAGRGGPVHGEWFEGFWVARVVVCDLEDRRGLRGAVGERAPRCLTLGSAARVNAWGAERASIQSNAGRSGRASASSATTVQQVVSAQSAATRAASSAAPTPSAAAASATCARRARGWNAAPEGCSRGAAAGSSCTRRGARSLARDSGRGLPSGAWHRAAHSLAEADPPVLWLLLCPAGLGKVGFVRRGTVSQHRPAHRGAHRQARGTAPR